MKNILIVVLLLTVGCGATYIIKFPKPPKPALSILQKAPVTPLVLDGVDDVADEILSEKGLVRGAVPKEIMAAIEEYYGVKLQVPPTIRMSAFKANQINVPSLEGQISCFADNDSDVKYSYTLSGFETTKNTMGSMSKITLNLKSKFEDKDRECTISAVWYLSKIKEVKGGDHEEIEGSILWTGPIFSE